MTHQQLDWLAEAVNPALLCAFLACSMTGFPSRKRALDFVFHCGLALLATFLLAHINRWMLLWRDHRVFPSGHMTFFLTVATSFFLLDRRSALVTVPLALLYGWLIVFLGHHSWFDLLGALLLAVPATLFFHRNSGGPAGTRQQENSGGKQIGSGKSPAFSAMEGSSRPSVLFVAGDLSGDAHSARLAERLAERHPGFILHALGGRSLGAAVQRTGGTWIGDTTNCSAIGLCSVLPIYLWARWLSFKMRRFVRSRPPDAAVLCDWGGFNCGQLEFFKQAGVPVLYYFPPRSWQRTGNAGLRFAPMVARVATPFEWSAARLTAAGCRADWVGHPILESVAEPGKRERLRREFEAGPGEKLVALLPGSRKAEVKVLGPRLAEVAAILSRERPVKFVVPVPEPLAERARAYFLPPIKILVGRAPDALLACDAAVVKTGSATLEAVAAGAPQVTVYDFGWAGRFEWFLLWMWKRIPFIAMPNIILQRALVPELLGLNCRPEAIAASVSRLLSNDEDRRSMEEGYREIRGCLGGNLPAGATDLTVKILEEMLGDPHVPHGGPSGSVQPASTP